MRQKLRAGYAVDVLLGNWDVVGASADNILVDANGEPWRIDNGGSLKFRAQGAQKTKDQWGEFIDDLWTMTGHGSRIDNTAPSNIPQYFGNVRPLEIAKEINQHDWTKALSTLPPDEKKVLENRLEEFRQIAERGADAEHFGRTQESTDNMLDWSYKFSKDGLREAVPSQVDINSANLQDWETASKWFHDNNEVKTLAGKKYGSFHEYIAERIGEDDFNFIQNANESQGGDSYDTLSVYRKLCVLKTQGFDCTDPKYATFDDFAQDVRKAGYYCGVNIQHNKHWKKFDDEFKYARSNKTDFDARCLAVDKYDAAVQIVLENTKLRNVDSATRTYVLYRTESPDALTDGQTLKQPQPGERCAHHVGVCESHYRVRTVTVAGSNVTVVRTPFSRIHGIWMCERGKMTNGIYTPLDHGQYLGAHENESGADTHGLPIVLVGQRSSIAEANKALKDWEKQHPNEAINGVQ